MKCQLFRLPLVLAVSSPARGMWIEIKKAAVFVVSVAVIPRTGDVD